MTKSFHIGIVLAGLLAFTLAPSACFAQEKANDEPGKLILGAGARSDGTFFLRMHVKDRDGDDELDFCVDLEFPNTFVSLMEQFCRKVVVPRLFETAKARVVRLSSQALDKIAEPRRSQAESFRELQDRSITLGLVERVH
jgi:hypothetical protein